MIEKIVPEFKNRGYKVGIIKHDVHKFEIDYEGKDTHRMTQAGADTVIIASGQKIAMVKKIDCEYKLDELSQRLLNDVDIIITEGYKRQDKPKIEVTQTGELLCSKDDNLLAIVINPIRSNPNESAHASLTTGTSNRVVDVPCFKLDNILPIVNLIEEKFLNKRIKEK